MNASVRFVVALSTAAVALGGAVLVVGVGASPASAEGLTAVSRAVVGPPPGQDWGIPYTQLPAGAASDHASDPGPGCQSSGGVGTPPVVANENSTVATPTVIRLCDPFSWAAAGGGYFFSVEMFQNPDTRSGAVGLHEVDGGWGYNGSSASYTCADTQYSAAANQTTYTNYHMGGFSGPVPTSPAGQTYSQAVSLDKNICSYLVSASIAVTYPHNGTMTNQNFIWSANTAKASPVTYSYDRPTLACVAGGSVSSQLCASIVHDSSHQCDLPTVDIINWQAGYTGDPIQGLQVTAQHMAAWGNISVKFWSYCLFNPAYGFDSHDWVKTAWLGSSGAQVMQPFTMTATAWQYAPQCGNIAGVGTGAFSTFKIDTCTWPASVTSPLTVVVLVAISCLSGWFILQQLIKWLLGIIRVESPVVDGKKA